MNPNTPQPQDQQNNGTPVAPLPPQPPQQQPPQVPGWFAGAPLPDDEPPQRDHSPVPVGKILKILTLVIVIAGLIGGIGYGLYSIFGVADQEGDRLAAAQVEFENAVKETTYLGDGTDIERTEAPKITYGCPTGLDKTGDGKNCIAPETTVSPVHKSCPKGYSESSDPNADCQKTVGGTKQIKDAVRRETCSSEANKNAQKSGDSCIWIDKTTPKIVYACAEPGFSPTAQNPQATCIKSTIVTSALIITCTQTGFVVISGGCVKTVGANKVVTTLKACPSTAISAGYTWVGAKDSGVCSRKPTGSASTPYCRNGTPTNNNRSCYLTTSRPTYYTYSCGFTGQGGSPNASHQCRTKVTTPKIHSRVDGVNVYICPTNKGWSSLNSTTCWKYAYVAAAKILHYGNCLSGWSPSGSKCTRTLAADHKSTLACPLATASISIVGQTATCYHPAAQQTTYNCTKPPIPGKLSGSKCVETGKASYVCTAGYTKVGTGTGTGCALKTGETMPTIKKKVCREEGYVLVDSKCQKVMKFDVVTTYECDPGVPRSGKKCIVSTGGKKVTARATISYHCPKGYDSEGTGKNMTCKLEGRSRVALQKASTCREGWKLRVNVKPVRCVLVAAQAL